MKEKFYSIKLIGLQKRAIMPAKKVMYYPKKTIADECMKFPSPKEAFGVSPPPAPPPPPPPVLKKWI